MPDIKKNRTNKIPKPIIKKEKTEEARTLQPMSYYIDDRLELVKQIFGTLKPKTITNLAPDFLKKKEMHCIQELCLNELLCISTKRLRSIINSTSCPSDTESSNDSDVQHNEEHISLEEISSDSEIGGAGVSNSGKNKNNATAENKNDKNNLSGQDKGQISVLELLELQARARAIRSQLAMEPITKIEVNSDDDCASNSSATTKQTTESRPKRKRASNDKELNVFKPVTLQGSLIESKSDEPNLGKSASPTGSKRIKLKRNYRNVAKNSDSNNAKEVDENSIPPAEVIKNNLKTDMILKDIKMEKIRTPSVDADVIPIEMEPETLLIRDSSDDELGETVENKLANSKQAYSEESNCKAPEKITRRRKTTEIEEGELTESETEKKDDLCDKSNDDTKTTSDTVEEIILINEEDDDILKVTEHLSEDNTFHVENSQTHTVRNTMEKEDPLTKSLSGSDENHEDTTSTEQNARRESVGLTNVSESCKDEQSHEMQMDNTDIKLTISDDEEDDQNDDIISIGGGDLESEIIEHLEDDDDERDNSTLDAMRRNGTSAVEENLKEELIKINHSIIELNSSDDETTKDPSESWHVRYLKSSKVSKVLAASRLGTRVRDKIKKSKQNKNDTLPVSDKNGAQMTSVFVSRHEDGSVEQYKELLEMSKQRAT